MSSSADPRSGPAALEQPPPLGWLDFKPRDEPSVPAEFISPESELLSLARRYEDELRKCREHSEQSANTVREVLFDLAVHVGRFEQLVTQAAEADEPLTEKQRHKLSQQFGVLKNQMLDTLRHGGVEVRDPLGLPAAQIMDWADVADWLYRDDFAHEVVARTQQAAVFHGGAPVRLALVVMGASLAQDGTLEAAATVDAAKTSNTPDTDDVPETKEGGDR